MNLECALSYCTIILMDKYECEFIWDHYVVLVWYLILNLCVHCVLYCDSMRRNFKLNALGKKGLIWSGSKFIEKIRKL